MTTFMTRYKTTEWFDLKFEKKKNLIQTVL